MQSKTKNPYIKAFADEFNGPQTNQGPYTRFQANLNVNQFCHIGADKHKFQQNQNCVNCLLPFTRYNH